MNSLKIIDLLEQAIVEVKKSEPNPVPIPIPPIPTPTPPTPPIPIGPKKHTVWVDKFSGKEKTTRFSSSGDNPQFKRFGAVVFGYWAGRSDAYVYNTKYHDGGRGHVEYHPGLSGKYIATWYYRATRNRSARQPDVRHIRNGVWIKEYSAPIQHSEDPVSTSTKFTFDLWAGDFIQIMPADPKSISFGRMEFRRLD